MITEYTCTSVPYINYMILEALSTINQEIVYRNNFISTELYSVDTEKVSKTCSRIIFRGINLNTLCSITFRKDKSFVIKYGTDFSLKCKGNKYYTSIDKSALTAEELINLFNEFGIDVSDLVEVLILCVNLYPYVFY